MPCPPHRAAALLTAAAFAATALPCAAGAPAPSEPAPGPDTRPAGVRAPATQPAAAELLPTAGDLQGLFDRGDYPTLLRQLPKVLLLRGRAATAYDRYALLLLKAETHLRMKTFGPAAAAFRDAAVAADDPAKAAYAAAVELLLKRSPNATYQPGPTKKVKPATIDVTDPDARKAALAALLVDELTAAAPGIEAAMLGGTPAELVEAVRVLGRLDVLDRAAEVGDEAKRSVADLRSRGAAHVARRLEQLKARHDEARDSATGRVRSPAPVAGPNAAGLSGAKRFGGMGRGAEPRVARRGLSAEDVRDLKEIVSVCEQLAPPNRRLTDPAAAGAAPELRALSDTAEQLGRAASQTLAGK
ncbi:MAG: hypothetical protein JWO31_617 [Phycisphaerales bacterium]|nr:hypothetical protein [Phycisphaerales bacterium]